MNKVRLLIFSLIIIAIIIASAMENKNMLGSFLGLGKKQAATATTTTTAEIPAVNISYGNIEPVFSSSSLIKDLPQDSVLLLRFYNFDAGERQWEKSYILKKGEVKEGFEENSDMTITLDSKYLSQLTSKNFCSVIKTANANGDLGTETKLSTAALLWKFKGMLKHRECLGF